MMALRIGIGLPFTDGEGNPHDVRSLGERARWIEEAGFSGIWMGDASFRDLATWPDPYLWMSGAAAATQNVELGFAALQLPLRHPVDNAQRMMTLQTLSGGRLSAGLAPGSTPMAFAAMGESFEGRFKKFNADVATIRALNRGEEVNGADLSPWPAVPIPRFLLAAWAGGKMLERAVNDYDGWLCSAGRTTVKTIVEGLARYRDLGGERALVASCSADLTARDIPMGDDDPFTLRCSPEEAADRLAWLAELGFDDILINIRDGRSKGPFDSDLEHDKLLELRSLYEPAPAYQKAAR
jgi:alkanesulfonate monooxygenase SsuD/methylene tetrahydromethanopterin reductase-like flavin-dependent oxidoreductase (luciferase family)